MIAVSGPGVSGGGLSLKELTGTPLILYRRYERFLLDAFHAQGLEPRVLCVCDDAGTPCSGQSRALPPPFSQDPWKISARGCASGPSWRNP